MQIKILVLFVLLGSVIFSTGCSMRVNKYFEYKQPEYACQKGSVRARLMGTFNSSEKVTTKGSPYELLVSFSSASSDKGNVIVSDVRLYDASTDELVFKEEKPVEKKLEEGSDGVYRAYFSFKNMDLKYIRYRLLLKLHIQFGEQMFDEEVKLYFDEDYKEFKSNDFWEKIMSV